MNEQPKHDGCPFCNAVAIRSTGQSDDRPENTPLYESSSFVVFPALGPVVPGHVLVVSKQHRPSFAQLTLAELREYEGLASDLLPRLPFADSQPIEAEHGATDADAGGATVVHAHMHWFPTDIDIAGLLDGTMRRILLDSDVPALANLPEVPYVFVRRKETFSHVFADEGIPSQLLRRLVSEAASDGQWDWRQQAHAHWVVETVARWRELS